LLDAGHANNGLDLAGRSRNDGERIEVASVPLHELPRHPLRDVKDPDQFSRYRWT
jgi:hypothetical protein